MELKEFISNVDVLDKQKCIELRKRYIDRFIDKNQKMYYEQIDKKYIFVDGHCYLGYLWDFLLDKELVSEDCIKELLQKKTQLYVFWDIHSCEKIFIKNYWNFDKEAILKMNFDVLTKGLQYLPQDIYIFDDNMDWTVAYTHENINDGRYCLWSGVSPENDTPKF